jgi:NAD(P)H-flavin reductase
MPKIQLTCLEKTQLAPKIYFIKMGCSDLLDFKPGQFISLEVAPKEYRSYSLISLDPSKEPDQIHSATVEFLVNTKSGGLGSQCIENMNVGDNYNGLGPLGKFALVESQKPKVFIATGTGLGPFIGMIKQIFNQVPNTSVQLYFGVYSPEYDFSHQFFTEYLNNSSYPNFKIITCADSLNPDQTTLTDTYLGKVTEILPKFVSDFKAYDFYICGNPLMVAAMESSLRESGADENIFMEKYESLAK